MINGTTILENLNIQTEAGQLLAFTKKYRINATNGKGIKIEYENKAGISFISAIKINKLF